MASFLFRVAEVIPFQDAPQFSDGDPVTEEIYANQPGSKDVGQVVKEVCVRNAIDGRVGGNREKKERRDVL